MGKRNAALNEFMDLGPEYEDESSDSDSSEPPSIEEKFHYDGDKKLIDITISEIDEFLSMQNYDFKRGHNYNPDVAFIAESPKGHFQLVVETSITKHEDATNDYVCDAIRLTIRESNSGYKVLEPLPIYRTEDWRKQLQEKIDQVGEMKDNLVFCNWCDGVMIIRRTNTNKKKIRGCSNYPNCRNKEILE